MKVNDSLKPELVMTISGETVYFYYGTAVFRPSTPKYTHMIYDHAGDRWVYCTPEARCSEKYGPMEPVPEEVVRAWGHKPRSYPTIPATMTRVIAYPINPS